MKVPHTRRDAVVDTLHGVDVADPYRWLEDGEAATVQQWVEAQNRLTRETLDALPDRQRWHERLVAFMQRHTVLSVDVAGGRAFVLERAAGADQARLVSFPVGRPADVVILADPAADSEDGAVAIDWFHPAPDGELVAVGISAGGTERSELQVIRTADGTALDDRIADTRAASVAWDRDGGGFVYTRYPAGDNYHRGVRYHRLGADPDGDPLWWQPDEPEPWADVKAAPDGARVLVSVGHGWSRTDQFLIERTDDPAMAGEITTMLEGVDATSEFHFVDDDTLVGVTTLDAQRGRVVIVDVADPTDWRTIIAEGDRNIDAVRVDGDELVVISSNAGLESVERYDLTGHRLGDVALPGACSVASLASDDGITLAVLDRFESPPSLWTLAGSTFEAFGHDPDDTACELVVDVANYRSNDGTMVPIKVIRSAATVVDERTPTILYGYGGFTISLGPGFSPRIAAWCEAGGQYAIAGLRGGNEFGEAWHLAGNRANKQQVFDDLHAAAEWLVDEGLTSSDRLAVVGGSNGGLLVGAAITQRPELYRAAWSAVPLLDMIRFPEFLIARLWTSEYGDPDVAEEFEWLHAYSPYHHVLSDTIYPATLFTTAEGDTRVDPLHARKMAAMMQSVNPQPDQRPVLLRQEGRAGHGVGKPVSKRAAEEADALAFLAAHTGLGATNAP